MRKKPQPLAGVERDALRREKFRARKRGVFRVLGLEAGHHALLQLPATVDEDRVVAGAAAEGVVVRGLGEYRVTPDDASTGRELPPALVIGFGNVTTRQFRHGIGVLAALVAA